MVKLETFKVTFSDNKVVYFPGDSVSGQLDIELDDTMEMKQIRIKLTGKARVAWNEGKQHYRANERFFNISSVVHGGGAADNETVSLSKGRHTYPFQFQLPTPLASSYEDNVGHIRYYVKARIERPSWQIDDKTKGIITVLDKLDLNTRHNMMARSGGSETKNLCCWCCTSGPIEGEVDSDRTGYVPGEWIVANGSVTNLSSSSVERTSMEIVQLVTYYTKYRTKKEIRSLVREFGPNCNPRQTVNLRDIKLQIPPVPPSELNHCKILDIQYAVMLMGHLRTCAINMRAYAPIIIGTVPISNLPMYGDLVPSNIPEAPQQTAPQVQSGQTSTTFGHQAPPPSYAAASGIFNAGTDKDGKATMGDQTYTPQYTFYDWNQSAFQYN